MERYGPFPFAWTTLYLQGVVTRKFLAGHFVYTTTPEIVSARKKAPNKMDAVYSHAAEILVLDPEVHRLSITDTYLCKLLACLAFSSWLGRS